jgi:FkbM family methyltransferase
MSGALKYLKAVIRKAANALGYEFVRYDLASPRFRLTKLLTHHRINVILDVGANAGQFGRDMRDIGFSGRLISFEPLADAFVRLQQAAQGDGKWQAVNIGLGEEDGQAVINVAANSQSSSFLPMLSAHSEAAPESRYVGEQSAEIRRLDNVFAAYVRPDARVLLKIDTQGFEMKVLQGAQKVLREIELVQVECSFVPLYEGAVLIEEMIAFLRGAGFDPIETMPAFHHRDSAHLMQADILFARR